MTFEAVMGSDDRRPPVGVKPQSLLGRDLASVDVAFMSCCHVSVKKSGTVQLGCAFSS